MISFILWYLTITLAGIATFPLAFRLLPGLSDRGYAFNRTLGLLLWGYFFWLLCSLGIIHNDAGGLIVAFVVLLVLSSLALRGINREELRLWWKSQRGLVLVVEVLFLAAFAAWTVVRAANPEIIGTEKPMEEAFINAILRSPTFPPHDPWLSGYSISYYYFGYVMVAMLAQITGTPGSIAFNLGIALVFALSASGAFGLVYNLLARYQASRLTSHVSRPTFHVSRLTIPALLGPFFVLIVSNLEGFLEILHSRGLFWQMNPSGGGTSSFWTWLGILDLNQPPTLPLSWLPRTFGTGNWWWWRASRVLSDYTYQNSRTEVIDEFPFFSYLLADLHPHVLAMPFGFLCMGLALNLYLGGTTGQISLAGFRLHLDKLNFALAAVVLGGMFFLNAWDFPMYIALFVGGYTLLRAQEHGWSWERLKDFLVLGVSLTMAGVILYLPFYLSFSSQAGGIVPNLIYVTRGAHLWVMFGSLLLPLGAFLIYLWRLDGNAKRLKKGLLIAMGTILTLWIASMALAYIVTNGLPWLSAFSSKASLATNLYLSSQQAPSGAALFKESIIRRMTEPGAWITLAILLTAVLGLLIGIGKKEKEKGIGEEVKVVEHPEDQEPSTPVSNPLSHDTSSPAPDPLPPEPKTTASPNPLFPPHVFALLMILVGALLVLAPEFFFLLDQFGTRMNTIFKFYYTAWLLWAAAAAYGTAVLLQELRRTWGIVSRLGMLVVLGMGLVYPTFGIWDKTRGFNPPQGLTLDGSAYLESSAPDELAAIHWLQAAPYGVIVEAVKADGGEYSDFARISEYSGDPTVLGWVGHEGQWRGGYKEVGTRQNDIQTLYTTRDWSVAQTILQEYDIRYVIVGPRERSTYRVSEDKFIRYLTPAFKQGDETIYAVPWDLEK